MLNPPPSDDIDTNSFAYKQWFYMLWTSISQVSNNFVNFILPLLTSAPSPSVGGLYYADGISWNPGQGAGVYLYASNGTFNLVGPFNYNALLSGTVSKAFSSPYYFNILDTQTNNYAGGENVGLFVGYQINGGKGAKTGISNITTFSAATANPASFSYYQSAFFKMFVQAPDGGTGLTFGTSKGYMYGLAAGIFAQNGATNLSGVTNEIDVSMSTGSSAAIKSGLSIIGGGLGGTLDNVAGTLHDSLLSFTTDSAGNIGYRQGISIGRQDSYWPINVAGSILSISQPVGGSPACANGIDLTGCTFTGSAYKSNGFLISNDGTLASASPKFSAPFLSITYRDTLIAVNAGGLQRFTSAGSGNYTYQINTAIAGDFSAATAIYSISANSFIFNARKIGPQGAAIASANVLTVGLDGNYFQVSGSVQINLISNSGWLGGSVIRLNFAGSPLVKHNFAAGLGRPILLQSSVDFSATPNSILSLIYDSTDLAWHEISRTVI